MTTDNTICPGCGADLSNVIATGESSVYNPGGSRLILCEPCFFAEDEAIDLAGTNDLPDRLASYRERLRRAKPGVQMDDHAIIEYRAKVAGISGNINMFTRMLPDIASPEQRAITREKITEWQDELDALPKPIMTEGK